MTRSAVDAKRREMGTSVKPELDRADAQSYKSNGKLV